jgi:hypothetical protein
MLANFIDNNNNNNKKNSCLMLCMLHDIEVHGKTWDSDPFIETHYIVYERFLTNVSIFDTNDDYDTDTDTDTDTDNDIISDTASDITYDSDIISISDSEYEQSSTYIIKTIEKMFKTSRFITNNYSNLIHYHPSGQRNHPTIRNFHSIISKPNYIKPEIGVYITLPTKEMIAILKTFWLRIIQRTWKKIYKERNQIIQYRKTPYALFVFQRTGKWPSGFQILPGLNGMLWNLK